MFRASDVRATLTLSMENSENLDDMLLLQTPTGLEEKAERDELAKTISEASLFVGKHFSYQCFNSPLNWTGEQWPSILHSWVSREHRVELSAMSGRRLLRCSWIWRMKMQTKTKQKTLQSKSSRTRKYCLRIKHKPKYWFPEPMSDWSLQMSFQIRTRTGPPRT